MRGMLSSDDTGKAAKNTTSQSAPVQVTHQAEHNPRPPLEAMVRSPILDPVGQKSKASILPSPDHGESATSPQTPVKCTQIADYQARLISLATQQPPVVWPLKPAPRPPDSLPTDPSGTQDLPLENHRAIMAHRPTMQSARNREAVAAYGQSRPSLVFEAMMCEVAAMARATPAATLSRLYEIWVGDAVTEAEKVRWMLSTLTHLDLPTIADATRHQGGNRIPPEKIHNVLALYESPASSLYIAALNPTKHIYHLSSTPLLDEMAPNIHSIPAPPVSSPGMPVLPQIFEAVYSFTLPPLGTSSDLENLIHRVGESLKPGGIFRLTIIDPLPCQHTLGNTLGGWLEKHLLENLEDNSRCTNPTKTIPPWLGKASLRAEGSTRTIARFYAVPENVTFQPWDVNPLAKRFRADQTIKAEIRSLIGRILWKEVWGEYVTASSWWWDDDACVQECLELGTFWEYHLIESVKGSDWI
ncbi:hypothetical protein RJ55_05920 [Drechmeria coniospora]|nr:hypothetical protein RJ55_05920 [Drechmeria coniospora]